MIWRLADRRIGRENLMAIIREQYKQAKTISMESLSPRCGALPKGGEKLKTLLDQQIDQVIDMD